MIGIYRIMSPTKKIYIGQSWDIEKRFNRNYKKLRCKGQKKLYNSLIKYGIDKHDFAIIKLFDTTVTQEELDLYEIYFVNLYEKEGFEMMNLRSGGKGGKLSQETKDKISNTKCKRITQFNKNGEVIKVWNSTKECAKKLNISCTSISYCLRGICKSADGFMFKEGEYTSNIEPYIKSVRKGYIKSTKKRNRVKRPIYQYDSEGNFIKEWLNMEVAAESLNLNSTCIGMAAKGKLKQSGGFQWKHTHIIDDI